jgi:hypothetical protein
MHMQKKHSLLLSIIGGLTLGGAAMAMDVSPPKAPDVPKVNDTVKGATDSANKTVRDTTGTTDKTVKDTTDSGNKMKHDTSSSTDKTRRKYTKEKKVRSKPENTMKNTTDKAKGFFK